MENSFSRDKYNEKAIIEYCNSYEEMGDSILDKGASKDLWKAFYCYEKAIEGPEDYEIASIYDYDEDSNHYYIDYDYFEKPDLNIVKDKFVKLSNSLEDAYKVNAWIDKPSWISIGDFYHIVQVNMDNPIVKEIVDYIIAEYGHSYSANNILMKPIWLEDEKYSALFDYCLLENIDSKKEKLCLLLKIYKNLHLVKFISQAGLTGILNMDDEERILDNNYTLSEYDLMRKIIEDFNKIYLDWAKIILKANNLYNDSEPLSLNDVTFLLNTAKEPFLENIYIRVFFHGDSTTLIECIDKYIFFYFPVKEKMNKYVM